MTLKLVWPAAEQLPGYVDALERGWSPDTGRPEAALEELARIARDPAAFLAEQIDREGRGPAVVLPDGSTVPRLPGYRRWLWDGEFCGVIGFRWQPGTTALPPTCLGHIGYSVVPWKRRRGYATRALALLLPDAAREGLPHVEITTDAENVASQRVIVSNGGQLVERFTKLAAHGGGTGLRFRIPSWRAGPTYDRIAATWDVARTTLAPALERLLGEALDGLPRGATVLDVGCGSGVPVARWLAARGCAVTGIDASPALLALAARAVPGATLLCGDLRTVDPGGPFDAVVAWDSIFHVPRTEHGAVFARLAAWLRPGGALVLSLGGSAWEGTSEMHGETFFYSGHAPAESLRLLAEAGLEVVRAEVDDPTSRGHLAVLARRRAD